MLNLFKITLVRTALKCCKTLLSKNNNVLDSIQGGILENFVKLMLSHSSVHSASAPACKTIDNKIHCVVKNLESLNLRFRAKINVP